MGVIRMGSSFRSLLGLSSLIRGGRPVLLWQMPRQVHAVVEHSTDLDRSIRPDAKQQKVPWLLHSPDPGSYTTPTVEKMIGPRVTGDFGSALGAGPVGTAGYVEDALYDQRLVIEVLDPLA